jgi:hypothetical protein
VSGHHLGQYSTTIAVYGEVLEELRRTYAECYKLFAAQGALCVAKIKNEQIALPGDYFQRVGVGRRV